MRIAAITPTGGRPQAWALCQRWMARQTRQPDAWIVVDDVIPRTVSGGEPGVTEAIYPTPPWCPGRVTLGRNLLAALDAVRARDDIDAVVVIEDDDWYAPTHVAEVERMLSGRELLAGDAPSRYYHVKTRRAHAGANTHHASMCATGWRVTLNGHVRSTIAAAKGEPFLDIRLWRGPLPDGAESRLETTGTHVGIKGLPGRPGVGAGHCATFGKIEDPDLVTLRQWIGDDAEAYERFGA